MVNHGTLFANFLAAQQHSASWRRITVCGLLEIFAAAALWQGKLTEGTWAWFAGALAGLYISNDTFEKVSRLYATVKTAQAADREQKERLNG